VTRIPEPTEPDLETDPLYNLIVRDNFCQIFAALEATERLIAILRALTWTDEAIAEMLNIQPDSVTKIVQRARRRLLATLPVETAGMLRGRRWLESTRRQVYDPNADLSTYQAALVLDFGHRGKSLIRRFAFLDEHVDVLLEGLRKAGLEAVA
jgi:hypothetical protein